MWSNQAIAIGDIRPQEEEVTEVEVPQVAAAPISTDVPDATLQQTPAATPARGSATLEGGSATPSTSVAVPSTPTPPPQGLNLEPIFEQEEAEGPEEE